MIINNDKNDCNNIIKKIKRKIKIKECLRRRSSKENKCNEIRIENSTDNKFYYIIF